MIEIIKDLITYRIQLIFTYITYGLTQTWLHTGGFLMGHIKWKLIDTSLNAKLYIKGYRRCIIQRHQEMHKITTHRQQYLTKEPHMCLTKLHDVGLLKSGIGYKVMGSTAGKPRAQFPKITSPEHGDITAEHEGVLIPYDMWITNNVITIHNNFIQYQAGYHFYITLKDAQDSIVKMYEKLKLHHPDLADKVTLFSNNLVLNKYDIEEGVKIFKIMYRKLTAQGSSHTNFTNTTLLCGVAQDIKVLEGGY